MTTPMDLRGVWCGYPTAVRAPEGYSICEASRQYMSGNRQAWMSMEWLRETHRKELREEQPQRASIHTELGFATTAGVPHRHGRNVLSGCITH
jgi:hypothetical protein